MRLIDRKEKIFDGKMKVFEVEMRPDMDNLVCIVDKVNSYLYLI